MQIDELEKLVKIHFPVFQYIKCSLGLTEIQLKLLSTELFLPTKFMSKEGIRLLRQVKKKVRGAQSKFKAGKKLYKLLAKCENTITEIILDTANINSLSPFEGINCPSLTDIQVSSKFYMIDNNKIDELDPLGTLNAPVLNQLHLAGNFINNIRKFIELPFQNLTVINLSQNYILNIQPLAICSFNFLQKIDLSLNYIVNIDAFRKNNTILKNIKYIDFSRNSILNISKIAEWWSGQIYGLYLHGNLIIDWKQIEKLAIKIKHDKYQITMATNMKLNISQKIKHRQVSRHKMNFKIQDPQIQVKKGKLIIDKSRKLKLNI